MSESPAPRQLVERATAPVPNATQRPAQAEPMARSQVWPEYDQFHQRFHQIEMEFIDEPKAAVQKAEKLMQEAIERMVSGLREEMQRMHEDVEHNSDTEHMRMAMLNYRRLMDSMAGRAA